MAHSFPLDTWFDDPNDFLRLPVGGWPPLWARWLAYRASDAGFAAFLDDLAAWLAAPPPPDWRVRFDRHLGSFRNRYFLFLLWSHACGDQPRTRAALPDIDWLGERERASFWRWYSQVENDEQALALAEAIHTLPAFREGMHYRGVDLTDAFDYALLPNLLQQHLHSFENQEPSA